jgi:hypothetical protein
MTSRNIRRYNLALRLSGFADDLERQNFYTGCKPIVETENVLGRLTHFIGLISIRCTDLTGEGSLREGE